MQICPNCSYKLVLLSHRRKYKCAKCSKLFPQKLIDNKEFRRYNKFQRQLDIQNIKQKKPKLTKEQKLQRRKEYRIKNIEKIKAIDKEYRNKNKDKINTKRRQRYSLNTNKILSYQKEWRKLKGESVRITKRNHILNNKDKYIILERIKYYRKRQKALTLQYLKNKLYTASNTNLDSSVPTYSHYQLLKL